VSFEGSLFVVSASRMPQVSRDWSEDMAQQTSDAQYAVTESP